MKRRVPSVPMRFVMVGLINTIVGLATIYFLKWAGGLGNIAPNVGGYSFGLVTGFVLNRNWVFYHSGPWLPAAARFFVVFGIAYAANLGTVLVLIDQFGINVYIAQAFGIPPYTGIFYLGSRYFAFPGRRPLASKPDLGVAAPITASLRRIPPNFAGPSRSETNGFR
jgi:putative flippase GtrA